MRNVTERITIRKTDAAIGGTVVGVMRSFTTQISKRDGITV